jgi:four helix bundle protein
MSMRQKEPITRDAMAFATEVHKMVDKLPRAEEGIDPLATQLIVSSMMIGPKYAGIVRGLDRGHVLDRLELCCGNADEATYWLDCAKSQCPDLAEEAERLRVKGLEISQYMHRRKELFLLGLNEIDGEVMPWAPSDDEHDTDENDLDLDGDETEAEWPSE